MGQEQSSTNDASANEPAVKQDYYELLAVERTATDDEIKKAYRRKALELHPDRNYGNEEGATRLFAEIQAAYEILADPQERAWYDSHRDVLLRGEEVGGSGAENYSYNMKLTSAEDVLKSMMRFNKNVQFTDTPTGFFGGLCEFFKQLAKEEDIACQWQDFDYEDYPVFGSKDDDYEDTVRPFYGVWSGFATKKSYSWKDKYRLSDAPDRRIRRLMEKENQKLRDEATAEYNDAIRSLVAFVRKRDPRVQHNQKSDAERQIFLKQSAAAQAARMKAKRQAEMEKEGGLSTWAHTAAKDEHEGGFSSESEIEEHEFECVVCDKTFKSEKQYQVHEKSKKHIKLLKELKRDMRRQGKDLNLQDKTETIENLDDTRNITHDVLVDNSKEPGITTGVTGDSLFQAEISDNDSADDKPAAGLPDSTSKTLADDTRGNDSDELDSDYAPRSAIESRLADDDISGITTPVTELTLDDTPIDSGVDTPSKSKVGKAKQKRAKKAAQQSGIDTGAASGMACAECKALFASRTKLFKHIEEEGHAALTSQVRPGGTKGGKSKKHKK